VKTQQEEARQTVAYIRVSTQEQAAEGFSLEAQEEKVRQYAALRDLGEVRIIRDEGCSGGNMERPGLQELVALCKRGTVGAVIVVALDRLSRRVRDTLYLVSEVFDGRVAFHSIRENLDTESATGRFVLNIMASVNELERDLIAERTSTALQAKSRKGERIGRAPLGYRGSVTVDPDTGETLPEGAGELIPVPEELETVGRILALRSEGKSLRAIAATLTAEGRKTKAAGLWAAETVRLILKRAAA
jgi:site-specific DNA recombinase